MGAPSDMRRILADRLQRASHGDLAHVVREDSGFEHLSPRRQADLDCVLHGTGFLVNGQRVDPTKVVVITKVDGIS